MPHEDSARPHDSAAAPWNYCSGCAAENRLRLADPKHLTDVECAAHEWQAKWRWLGSVYSDAPILPSGLVVGADPIEVTRELDRRKHTWARFAAHPHALDADGATP